MQYPIVLQVALNEARACCEALAQTPAAEPAAACGVPASEPRSGAGLLGTMPDSLQRSVSDTERQLKQARCSAAQPYAPAVRLHR